MNSSIKFNLIRIRCRVSMLAKKMESHFFKVYCHCSFSMADINILREQAKKERQEKAAAQRASLHNNKVRKQF